LTEQKIPIDKGLCSSKVFLAIQPPKKFVWAKKNTIITINLSGSHVNFHIWAATLRKKDEYMTKKPTLNDAMNKIKIYRCMSCHA
jgi:hypothetical protein